MRVKKTKAMGFLEMLLLAVALSMDAFSVSVCKGLTSRKFSFRTALICGLWFGGFQALMPLIGFFLGFQFLSLIESFDHWVAFVLLALIGLNMIYGAFSSNHDSHNSYESLDFKTMLLLALATSIDALAVGISFACLHVNVWHAVLIIGLTTFALSVLGVRIGNLFGAKWGAKAEFFGGVILILIGLKILLEHLGFIQF